MCLGSQFVEAHVLLKPMFGRISAFHAKLQHLPNILCYGILDNPEKQALF